MIWLRHELWEYPDGLGYRLASKAETDRLTAAHPDGHLKQIFYAPSPAAAEAQYCALRGMGPYIVNSSDSETPFTMAQLETQLADFPDDHRLARQPALPEPEGGHPPMPVETHDHEPVHTPEGSGEAEHAAGDAGHDHKPAHTSPHDAHEADHNGPVQHGHAEAHAEPDPHAAHNDHASHAEASSNSAPALAAAPDHEPAHPASDGLGPISAAAVSAPVWAGKRRKKSPFLGFLKLIWLLIVIGAVIIGVGIVTGYLDGPTLLTQARELPTLLRDHSIVRTLLPDLVR